MPGKQNDINLNTVVLIAGGIILLPIITALINTIKGIGSILSIPDDIATELNRQFNQAADAAAYDVMYNHVLLYDFNPNNPDDVIEYNKLLAAKWLTDGQKQTLINVWKMPALPKKVLKGATDAVIRAQIALKIKELRKFF